MEEKISDYKHALDESAIVAITDHKGIITHVNSNFCKISKYTAGELIGKDHRIINSGYHTEEYIRELWKTIANGKVWKGELRNKAKDGTIYWVDTTIVPFLDPDGKPYQYVSIRSDITERKRGEEYIKRSEERAIEHSRSLEHKNRQLIDFCNIVSHNLRGPLLNISMLVDYMDQCKHEAECEEVRAKIKPVVNHLMEVFDELVESIQVKQDTGIKSEEINLKNCLDKILAGFEGQIKQCGADIKVDFREAPTVSFPRKYLENILTNFVDNALKYRHPERNPIITIKSKKINDLILLSVADNGLGIDLERHKDHLFKFRKTFHKHVGSKGFGLFMAKNQVEVMGGKIRAESTPGTGSTFFIELKA